jgi:hypothetical protein
MRFTDNNDGTVTDNLTGLVWLKNANPCGKKTWQEAIDYCKALASGQAGLTDGSQAGDWRLPSVNELISLLDYAYYNPAICNTAGTGQWSEGDPFSGVQSDNYWSGSTIAVNTGNAWNVYVDYGDVSNGGKTYTYYVWPVRNQKGEQQ